MSKRLIQKINGQIVGVSDFEVDADSDQHKAKLLEANPESTFEEIDTTAEVEAKKAKEEKKSKFSFKGNTIAALRQELNEWLELQK